VPELPDVIVYEECLRRKIAGKVLRAVRIADPFLLRTATVSPSDAVGAEVRSIGRIGKRIAIGFANDVHLVFHLMIAGRLHWQEGGSKGKGRALAELVFEHGRLTLTEAGTRRRASLHVVRGAQALAALDPGGVDVRSIDFEAFVERLRADNHTLKRALTDPHRFSGIGNAYSDEILHRAQLSPFLQTRVLSDEDARQLFAAARSVLTEWIERLREQARAGWPAKVTAFHPQMAVHGRYGEPCPVCAAPVQRIVYAENETNYCARCQTGGKVLADRALSRLLKASWPRSIDALD
jgi:formamidopyrimidine-DNA glycosylase